MIKNIIFDLGNVVLNGTHSYIIRNMVRNEEEKIFVEKNYLKSPEWDLMDRGMITNDEAIIKIKNRSDKRFHNFIEKTLHEWYKKQFINRDIVDLAKRLKEKGYNLYVLSNMSKLSYEYFKDDEFFSLCSGIVVSAYEHIKKPDKKIFEILLKRYNIKAGECLFIDDDDTNKSFITANELGLLGRRVEPNSKKDIVKLLNEFNIEF